MSTDDQDGPWIYAKCITRNGKRICHPTGVYRFRAKKRRHLKP